jgi:hypothetical protein
MSRALLRAELAVAAAARALQAFRHARDVDQARLRVATYLGRPPLPEAACCAGEAMAGTSGIDVRAR